MNAVRPGLFTPMNTASYLGVIPMKTRIKDLRTDKDLTQTEVAEAIGITQRKYSYLETGRQQWPDDLLVRLADLYQTSVDYLLCQTDDPRPYLRRKRK